jgi:spore germination cell wall hydrolase CwlJ-like protein
MRASGVALKACGLRPAARTVGALGTWLAACGALVSFTASAGQIDGSAPIRTGAVEAVEAVWRQPSLFTLASAFHMPDMMQEALVAPAALSPEEPQPINPRKAWLEPRPDLKSAAAVFPDVNRSMKGDPWPPLRPTISASLRPSPKPPTREELDSLIFGANPTGVVSHGFTPEATDLTRLSASDFTPKPLSEAAAPTLLAALPSHPAPDAPPELADEPAGMLSPTPLASLSPAILPPEPPQRPTDLGAGAGRQSIQPKAVGGGRFAGIVEKASEMREMRCLAEAVYFEARSETEEGQAAVAQVVLNRVLHENYPDTICGVVYQNRHRFLACQFTFACEGRSLRITEPEAWRTAVQIATGVADGTIYLADVGASTHYHADYVRPRWARSLKRMDTIGRHTFYRLRPGQS